MEDGLVVQVLGGHHSLDDVLHEVLVDLVVGHVRGVLGGDKDGVHALGDHGAVLLLVLHGDLGLAVRAQPGHLTVLPHLHAPSMASERSMHCEAGGTVGIASGTWTFTFAVVANTADETAEKKGAFESPVIYQVQDTESALNLWHVPEGIQKDISINS